LDVKNPFRGPFPDWRPVPLSQTQTNGPVVFTLERLQERVPKTGRYVQPLYKLVTPDSSWKYPRYEIVILDATGNEGGSLSPREPAWKVRARIYRVLPELGPGDWVGLTNVPVLAPGQHRLVNHTGIVNGITVNIQAVAGSGSLITDGTKWLMITNTIYSGGNKNTKVWSSRGPFILVEAKNVRPGDQFVLKVWDDQGRELPVVVSTHYSESEYSGTERTYQRAIAVGSDSKFLTFQAIINRPLEFEFMVNPADVQSAEK
jgi:hypothetical protein